MKEGNKKVMFVIGHTENGFLDLETAVDRAHVMAKNQPNRDFYVWEVTFEKRRIVRGEVRVEVLIPPVIGV